MARSRDAGSQAEQLHPARIEELVRLVARQQDHVARADQELEGADPVAAGGAERHGRGEPLRQLGQAPAIGQRPQRELAGVADLSVGAGAALEGGRRPIEVASAPASASAMAVRTAARSRSRAVARSARSYRLAARSNASFSMARSPARRANRAARA
jgi:hypothetical protein